MIIEVRMKKKLVVLVIVVLFVVAVIEGLIIYSLNYRNPVKDRLELLDPQKITGCWITLSSYEYIETNPQKVNALYEAFCHMKLKERKYDLSYEETPYWIAFIQDGKNYVICSYHGKEVMGILGTAYRAEVTNLEEVEKKYGLNSLLNEMIEKAKKENEEQY